MSTDIRLDVGFLDNIKTRKMVRELGEHAVVCTLRLWSYAALRHPKGHLNGMTEEDLEDVAGWTGMRGAYASYSIRMRWVDKDDTCTLHIHDWKEHQPYIYHSDKRIEAAKMAADERWKRKRIQPVNAPRMRGACAGHAGGNAPVPDPDPVPKDQNHRFVLPPIIRADVWHGFEEMRKRIRKPLTDHARKLILGKLKRLGGDPNGILEESTMNGWAGVFQSRDTPKPPVDCLGRAL